MDYHSRLDSLREQHSQLIDRVNIQSSSNGVWTRYQYPVLTAEHSPLYWRYDLNPETNPLLLERFGINGVFNTGAIRIDGKYTMVARVEGNDRKSFFAIAQSDSPVDGFKFLPYPIDIGNLGETNVYDMRLTKHEDGWIYGIFCAERHDDTAPAGDLSSAVAEAGVVRTKDMKVWERLPNIKSSTQQRNVVLHPEFVKGKYALYTRPQGGFIEAGSEGMGIGFSLLDDMCNAVIAEEEIIDSRLYHTVKETKNGEGPQPLKTPQGWLHMAHGVRGCAAGLRYVLYMYMTSLEDPTKVIAAPPGHVLAPVGQERVGDVSNVLFTNGWIADEDGSVYLYYASCDTRIHVAVSTIDRLVDYCMNSGIDGLTSETSVSRLTALVESNLPFITDRDR